MMQVDSELTQLAFQFERALLSLDRLAARHIIVDASSRWTPVERVEHVIAPALSRLGQGWKSGWVALSQIYMSGRICEELVIEILPPGDPGRKDQPRMAIAVLEDHHALGKRMVYAVLRASGYDLLDYGMGVSVDDLIRRTLADRVEVLLISTLMLRSALRVKEVTRGLRASGMPVQVVVGGAPFSFDDQLWKEVGAAAMGQNAGEAVAVIHNLKETL
jgi:methanogenic corrinoid protein MtbC1